MNRALFLFFLLAGYFVQGQILDLPPARYPLKFVTGYCLADTTIVTFKVEYTYDSKKSLIRILKDVRGAAQLDELDYEYDTEGNMTKELFYRIQDNEMRLERFSLYSRSSGRVVIETYNASNILVSRLEQVFAGKSIIHSDFSNVRDGETEGQNTSDYSYDGRGRLLKEETFSAGNLNRSIEYEYRGANLVKITTKEPKNEEVVIFEYLDNGLIRKSSNDKILQEDVWSNSRLISRRSYNWGFDICHYSICCGNTLMKIESY